jgi:hypothetical protein
MTTKDNASTESRSDDDIIKFGQYVVGFFDLLGQAELLRQMDFVPRTEGESAAFTQKLRKTMGPVLVLRSDFQKYFQGITQHAPSLVPLMALTKEFQDMYARLRDTRLEMQHFFDSVIIYCPVANRFNEVTTIGAHGVLVACGMAMLLSLARQMPLRGAVELGVCGEIAPGDIYGSGVVKAHDLEEGIARYPRIVIGKDLIVFLTRNTLKTSQPIPFQQQVNDRLAREALGLICKDCDEVPMIDFLGQGFLDMSRDPAIRIAVKAGFDFVTSECTRFTQEGKADLAERYRQLKRYFHSRAHLWPDVIV